MSTVNYRSHTQTTRGFDVKIQVPATVEDFDLIAGPNGTYNHAIDESMYRAVLPKGWKLFMEKAPERFSFERKLLGKKPQSKRNPDAEPADIYEDIKDYLPRLKAHIAETKQEAELAEFVQSCFNEVGFDLTTTERSKKVPKEWLDRANEVLAKIKRGDSTVEASTEKFAARGVTEPFILNEAQDGYDIDHLARKIKEFYSTVDELV